MTVRGGVQEDDELWTAVAEPGRRMLLDLLLARGEATASSLAAELPFTRQAAAKHLAVLQRAGLVDARREGREVRYTVGPERLDAATRALARVAADWERRLDAIKRLAEERGVRTGSEGGAAEVPGQDDR
ncbi:MAG TPA: metalloregulator ArsR/SmtB family transcription factor [Solirubrobacteraceae bacterium]|nr:metalloregulator ArsR/SmtB family transcription factor [Solirubrobacteraceae bacterium]